MVGFSTPMIFDPQASGATRELDKLSVGHDRDHAHIGRSIDHAGASEGTIGSGMVVQENRTTSQSAVEGPSPSHTTRSGGGRGMFKLRWMPLGGKARSNVQADQHHPDKQLSGFSQPVGEEDLVDAGGGLDHAKEDIEGVDDGYGMPAPVISLPGLSYIRGSGSSSKEHFSTSGLDHPRNAPACKSLCLFGLSYRSFQIMFPSSDV